jgi:RNA polymerase sigma-70 factor (ECF subfamily)
MDGAGTIYNNAMLRVFRAMADYRHENKLGAWIRSITVNCCIDYVKQRTRFTNKVHIGETVPEASEDGGIPGNISAKEIQRIINQLPGATSAVFNLYIYENLTHQQIGKALGISEGTSKWHVSEARKRLRSSLKEFITP